MQLERSCQREFPLATGDSHPNERHGPRDKWVFHFLPERERKAKESIEEVETVIMQEKVDRMTMRYGMGSSLTVSVGCSWTRAPAAAPVLGSTRLQPRPRNPRIGGG